MNLTQTIQNWVSGGATDYGLLFKASNESAVGMLQLNNHNAASNQPHLSVEWNNWDGAQSWFPSSGQSLNDRMGLGVNLSNGNLVLHARDVSIKGTGLDLHLDRYYNSLSGERSHLGQGWTSSLGCDVKVEVDNDGISYEAPDGYAILLRPDGSGGWTAPGIEATLTQSGSTYTLNFHSDGTKFNFASGGCLQSVVDRNGNTISLSYGGTQDDVQSLTDTRAHLTQFTYTTINGTDLLSQIQDPSGRLYKFAYDANNNLSQYTDPAGGITKYAYNSEQQVNQITDPRGNVINITYGASYPYPVKQVSRVNSACSGGACTTSFTYNSGSTQVTDGNGHVSTYTYDSLGRATGVTDPLGHTQSIVYTSDNTPSSVTNPNNVQSQYWYDVKNNLTQTSQAGLSSSAVYTDTNHPYSATTTTDSQGNSTTLTYDTAGNTHTVKDPLGFTTTYAYNANGTLASVTDPKGNVTSYQYDTYGNVTKITYPAPLGAVTYAYDTLGRLSSQTDGLGQQTTYTYDAFDRIFQVTYAAGRTITYGFDANGNQTAMSDSTGSTTFAFDAMNRATSQASPGGTVSYTWDSTQNLASRTDSGGTEQRTYNAGDQLVSIKDPTGAASTLQYDADARLTQLSYPNGVAEAYTYNSSNQIATIKATYGSSTLTNFTYAYTNPTTNQPMSLASSMTDASTNVTSYGYDADGRLLSATKKSSGGSTLASYQYTYDATQNVASQSLNGVNTNFTYNAANELTQAGSVNYSYDANGNLLGNSAGLSLTYNSQTQTSSITPSGGSALSMTYTDVGQNLRTAAGATSFKNDLAGISSLSLSGADTYFTRLPNGLLLSERVGGNTYYYLHDALQSTVALVNSAGSIVDSYAYDPFGNITSQTEAVSNTFKWTGAVWDSSTQMYKMGTRYYSPALARFTQPDPLRLGLNHFAYSADDPIDFSDPSGDVYVNCHWGWGCLIDLSNYDISGIGIYSALTGAGWTASWQLARIAGWVTATAAAEATLWVALIIAFAWGALQWVNWKGNYRGVWIWASYWSIAFPVGSSINVGCNGCPGSGWWVAI